MLITSESQRVKLFWNEKDAVLAQSKKRPIPRLPLIFLLCNLCVPFSHARSLAERTGKVGL